jgi:hypothetical protein
MIQLNLLPDVKLEYLRAQRTKRLAMVISFIVTAAAVAILIIMLSVEGFQKHTLGNLNKNVASETTQLRKEPQINSVLTVQNQLESINQLHASEPAANRLFDYLNELTPTSITIGNLAIDFNAHTISISGSADALSSVDQYVDTLKFTNYTTGPNTKDAPAFSSVVLSSFSLDNTTAPPADYTITANFDPTIFYVTKNVSLVIPSQVTTRSALEHPGPLFAKSPSHSSSSSATTGGGN